MQIFMLRYELIFNILSFLSFACRSLESLALRVLDTDAVNHTHERIYCTWIIYSDRVIQVNHIEMTKQYLISAIVQLFN